MDSYAVAELRAAIHQHVAGLPGSADRAGWGIGRRPPGARVVADVVLDFLLDRFGQEYVVVTDDGWHTEHSMQCRLDGMDLCPIHLAMDRTLEPPCPPGRYKARVVGTGVLLEPTPPGGDGYLLAIPCTEPGCGISASHFHRDTVDGPEVVRTGDYRQTADMEEAPPDDMEPL